MQFSDFRTVVGASPSDTRTGLVLRWPIAAALVETENAEALEELVALLHEEVPPQAVAAACRTAASHPDVSALIAIVEAPGGPWVLLHGNVELHTQGETLQGATDPGERQLTATQSAVHLSLSQPATDAAPLGAALGLASDADPTPSSNVAASLIGLVDLQAGTVFSSTLSLLPMERRVQAPPPLTPPVAESPEAAAAPDAFDSGAFDFVDLRHLGPPTDVKPLAIATTAVPEPAEVEADPNNALVRGIVCSRDHFNDPRAAFCMVCGISMVHVTHNLVEGVRPTLGFLVFDDGSTFTLDRSYVLGREPGQPAEPGMDGLLVPDPERQSVSRRHAEIRLDGWFVNLIDLGSTNGSFTWSDTTQSWQSLPAHQPISLSPGVTVALGRRTFIFESVHRI